MTTTLQKLYVHPTDTISPETGLRVRRWTDGKHLDQHLYFTTPSITADDRYLVFLSDRSGSANLWAIDRTNNELRQISHAQALLRTYCYPRGGERGFSKPSPYVDTARNLVYWMQDNLLMRAQLESGEPEVIATLPEGWVQGFTHLSDDGSTFCVPVASAHVFHPDDLDQCDQMAKVAARMKVNPMTTCLCFVDVASGEVTVAAEIPFWSTHVQFQPGSTQRLLFNSEGSWHHDASADAFTRIWRLDENGSFRKLFEQPSEIKVSHENFSPDGQLICYHGTDKNINHFVETRNWHGQIVWRSELGKTRIGHSTLMNSSRTCAIDNFEGWILKLDLPKDGSEGTVKQLCRHDTSWKNQDVHPHPRCSPSGKSIVFSSDKDGSGNVYEVILD